MLCHMKEPLTAPRNDFLLSSALMSVLRRGKSLPDAEFRSSAFQNIINRSYLYLNFLNPLEFGKTTALVEGGNNNSWRQLP